MNQKLISWALRRVPRPVLQRWGRLYHRLIAPFYYGRRHRCPIENRGYRTFLPYGRGHIRPNALCPGSLSLERHRLLWLYLQRQTDFFSKPHKMLHIAPELCFLKPFRANKQLDYTTGDLESPWADVHFDLHDAPFDDGSFDVIFCNHVLEHVDDDIACMKQILRMLKPGGWAILQSPIDHSLEKTIEDKTITDPQERERLFRQSDHMRLYGLDYGDRLRAAGFQVQEEAFLQELSAEEREYYRLPGTETIYRCFRPAAAEMNS